MYKYVELQKELRELLALDLLEAIQLLKKKLPEKAKKQKDLFLFEGRVLRLNQEQMRGLIAYSDYQVQINTISNDYLNFINQLADKDFNTELSSSEYRRGSILYEIPSIMELNNTVRCKVRIAFDKEIILRNIILSEDTNVQDIARVSDIMQVELIDLEMSDKAFSIYSISEKEQFLDEDDYTEWLFQVKPLLEGSYPLILKVSIVEIINEKERKRNIVFDEKIEVISSKPKNLKSGFKVAQNNIFLYTATDEAASKVANNWLPIIFPTSWRNSVSQYKMAITTIFIAGASLVWAIPSYIQYKFWKKTEVTNTIKGYEIYLSDYPNGRYKEQAVKQITILRNQTNINSKIEKQLNLKEDSKKSVSNSKVILEETINDKDLQKQEVIIPNETKKVLKKKPDSLKERSIIEKSTSITSTTKQKRNIVKKDTLITDNLIIKEKDTSLEEDTLIKKIVVDESNINLKKLNVLQESINYTYSRTESKRIITKGPKR